MSDPNRVLLYVYLGVAGALILVLLSITALVLSKIRGGGGTGIGAWWTFAMVNKSNLLAVAYVVLGEIHYFGWINDALYAHLSVGILGGWGLALRSAITKVQAALPTPTGQPGPNVTQGVVPGGDTVTVIRAPTPAVAVVPPKP